MEQFTFMEQFAFIAISIACALVGFGLGRISKSFDVITLKDVLSGSGEPRDELKRAYHGALQLQNEIAESGALKIKELENGDYEVRLKVIL